MARLPLVALPDFPPALREALERGRATGMLSTPVPVQVWAHRPEVALAWLLALEAMHARGLLDERLRELVRLRIAAITTCHACRVARKTDAVSDEDVGCLTSDSDRFTERERAALRYAELFAGDYLDIDEALYRRLEQSFTVAEIVELNMFCALMLAGGRMTHVQQAYEEIPS
jgi:alkylhydroperoxidase family enzyme